MFNGDLLDAISMLHNPKDIHAGSVNFQATQTGSLTKALHHVPLPKDGYYFHPDAVVNLVLMTVVSNHHFIVMDTDVNNFMCLMTTGRIFDFNEQSGIYTACIVGKLQRQNIATLLQSKG